MIVSSIVATYTKQVVRKFQTEAKKILRASLPVKSSVPKVNRWTVTIV